SGSHVWRIGSGGPLDGKRFAFDTPLYDAGLFTLIGGARFRVEFSYTRSPFTIESAATIPNTSCSFDGDSDLPGLVVCDEPGTGAWVPSFAASAQRVVYWRVVQTYKYDSTVGDLEQASTVWPLRIGAPNDVDDSGKSDLLVGGAVPSLFLDGKALTSTASTQADVRMARTSTTPFSYGWVEIVEDITNDGYDDIVVTDDSGSSTMTWVLKGRSSANWAAVASLKMDTEVGAGRAYTISPPSGSYPQYFGRVVAWADLNNDKVPDLVIGQYASTTDEGRLFIFYGPITGNRTADTADAIISGDSTPFRLGISVARAGDVNGDGIDDIITAADSKDAAWIITGSSTNLTSGTISNRASMKISGWSASKTGRVVATARDVNQDGYADLLVGSPSYDKPSSESGATFIVYSPGATLSNVTVTDSTGWNRFETVSSSACQNCRLGSCAAIGRLYSDARLSLIAGARAENSTYPPASMKAGTVYVVNNLTALASQLVMETSATAIARGTAAGDDFGRWCSVVGDLDGDGREDVAMSAWAHNSLAGHVWIFTGATLATKTGTLGESDATAVIDGTASEMFGWDLSSYPSAGEPGY
ncbi:MAG: VCBS repeat-containing protein, partial [Deltaproteobacteria bacterium]|nr:VCBS repeat-containing protein [Deltaproteobacteria bacterium]